MLLTTDFRRTLPSPGTTTARRPSRFSERDQRARPG
jgi:hypothetical protein